MYYFDTDSHLITFTVGCEKAYPKQTDFKRC